MTMGLDIRFYRRKQIVCPKCGEVIGHTDVDATYGSGRGWYPFLESIGYYVPYEQRTEENDWYGKDMKLTEQQTDKLYEFVKKNDPICSNEIMGLIALARMEDQDVIINADW
jgi:hypothetical protein